VGINIEAHTEAALRQFQEKRWTTLGLSHQLPHLFEPSALTRNTVVSSEAEARTPESE
jgi:hypothetical protein